MHETQYDEVTGLPKRAQFETVLARGVSRCKRHHTMLAIMYLDLNDFKSINKTYGDAVGDEVLKEVTKLLQENLRKEEFIARVGGDEFIILVEDVNDIGHIDAIAQKIQMAFAEPIKTEDQTLLIDFCMGIAVCPFAGDTEETLLKHADMALYMAKSSGKDHFRYFTPELNEKSERHLQIGAALQTALRDHEFYLSYNPVYDLHTNKLVAAEARLNWCSNEFGDIALSEFVPVARDLGLMTGISHWELTKACETLASWNIEGFHLYITITQPQFENDRFVHELQALITRLKLDPELIVLKIDENLISDFEHHHQEKLEELSELEFSIAVDDYGTGASSLSQLKRLCINSLKIDDSFTEEIGKNEEFESIIEAAIKMAHCLDLYAIAEGVETEEQLSFLKRLGCDLAQGSYFSESVDEEEFMKLMKRVS